MIKNLTDISKLTAYLAADYKNFHSFYQEIIVLLKKEKSKKLSFFTEIFFKDLKDKLNLSYWEANRNKLLFGVPYTAKDLFASKTKFTTGSSKILRSYQVGENASIIDYINENGGILIGKVHLDEFGTGGSGLFSSMGEFSNPHDSSRIVGGSSSGSVLSVINQVANFSLCSDTGNSVRYPALLNGMYGFKPTYGAVSRFGMLSCFAPSLDTVGVIANDYRSFRQILSVIIRDDPKDGASFSYSFPQAPTLQNPKSKKIGYFELTPETASSQALQAYNLLITKLKNQGFDLTKIEIPIELTKTLQMVYELIAYPFLLSSLSNLKGINFGTSIDQNSSEYYEKQIEKVRTENLGTQVKQRLILGTFFTEPNQIHYLKKAQQYRQYVNDYATNLLKKYDFILHLGADLPPSIKATKEEGDNFSVDSSVWFLFANFAGFPSYSLPFAWIDKLPLGIGLFAEIGQDSDLIDMGSALADAFNFTPRFQ